MDTILFFGVLWILYGCAGLLGVQKIPSKFKGYAWTRRYTRWQGGLWLVLGIPWVLLCAVMKEREAGLPVMLALLLGCSLPGLIYSLVLDSRYNKKLEREEARTEK